MQLTDKYGLSAAVARKRAGLPPLHNLSLAAKPGLEPGDASGQVAVAPSEAKGIEEVEQLEVDDLFGKPVDLTKIATLEQRLAQVKFRNLDQFCH